MRCETCASSGRRGYLAVRVRSSQEGFAILWAPCPDCIGGIASCCDTAGAAQPDPQRRAVMTRFNYLPEDRERPPADRRKRHD
jgi:hypothetical protein